MSDIYHPLASMPDPGDRWWLDSLRPQIREELLRRKSEQEIENLRARRGREEDSE